jgi:hypothetical protein
VLQLAAGILWLLPHFLVLKQQQQFFVLQELKAELLLALLIAERHLPFLLADRLKGVLPRMFPDSDIAAGWRLGLTKATYLITHVLGPEVKSLVVKLMRANPFSIIVDEATDIKVSSQLGIMVKVLDPTQSRVLAAMFDLVELGEATGLGLFTAMNHSFATEGLNFSNVIGYGADTTSVVSGSGPKSLKTAISRAQPNIFHMPCTCHSAALVASYAAQKLPKFLEELPKDLTARFKQSHKRLGRLARVKEVMVRSTLYIIASGALCCDSLMACLLQPRLIPCVLTRCK